MAAASAHLNMACLKSLAVELLYVVSDNGGVLPAEHPINDELNTLTVPCRERIDMFMLGAQAATDLIMERSKSPYVDLTGTELLATVQAEMSATSPTYGAKTAEEPPTRPLWLNLLLGIGFVAAATAVLFLFTVPLLLWLSGEGIVMDPIYKAIMLAYISRTSFLPAEKTIMRSILDRVDEQLVGQPALPATEQDADLRLASNHQLVSLDAWRRIIDAVYVDRDDELTEENIVSWIEEMAGSAAAWDRALQETGEELSGLRRLLGIEGQHQTIVEAILGLQASAESGKRATNILTMVKSAMGLADHISGEVLIHEIRALQDLNLVSSQCYNQIKGHLQAIREQLGIDGQAVDVTDAIALLIQDREHRDRIVERAESIAVNIAPAFEGESPFEKFERLVAETSDLRGMTRLEESLEGFLSEPPTEPVQPSAPEAAEETPVSPEPPAVEPPKPPRTPLPYNDAPVKFVSDEELLASMPGRDKPAKFIPAAELLRPLAEAQAMPKAADKASRPSGNYAWSAKYTREECIDVIRRLAKGHTFRTVVEQCPFIKQSGVNALASRYAKTIKDVKAAATHEEKEAILAALLAELQAHPNKEAVAA